VAIVGIGQVVLLDPVFVAGHGRIGKRCRHQLARPGELLVGQVGPVPEQVVEALVEDLLAPPGLVQASDGETDQQITDARRVEHVGVQQRHQTRHPGQ